MIRKFAGLGSYVGVGVKTGGHTFITIGFPQCKIQAMRENGKAAQDLLEPMTWDVAADLNAFIRENWPEPDLHNLHGCDCEACKQRRLLRATF